MIRKNYWTKFHPYLRWKNRINSTLNWTPSLWLGNPPFILLVPNKFLSGKGFYFRPTFGLLRDLEVTSVLFPSMHCVSLLNKLSRTLLLDIQEFELVIFTLMFFTHLILYFPFRYIVEQRTLPSMHWKRYQSNIEDTKLDIKSYDVKKDYMYRVIAFNEFGRSDPSNSLSVYAKTRKLTMSCNSWRNHEPFSILEQVGKKIISSSFWTD